jgi:hypothetical protein
MVPVRLRGHHFLCILTYKGYGYTPAFVANLTEVVTAIANGQPVHLVEGPDDICNGFTEECRALCDHDCARPDTMEIDRLAVEAIMPLLPATLEGMILDAATIDGLRKDYARGAIRAACQRCSWKDLCDDIVASGFDGVKLFAASGSS